MYLEAPGDQGFSTILASRFENNWAGSGAGGLLLSNLSLVTVADTVIAGNVVAGLEGDQLARGGGILVHYANAIIERSAFHHNRAGTIPATAFGGGGTQVGEGGALAIINESVVDIDNTTFAHNRVAGATELGAALLVRASTVDLHTSTITDSRAAGRDAVRLEDSAQLELARSLVDGGCSISGATVASAQANVEVPWGGGGTTCNLGAGDLVVADLGLRPLAIYGGPFGVPTQALLPGSPAAGLVSSASCADEDARSAPRLGLFCDAGPARRAWQKRSGQRHCQALAIVRPEKKNFRSRRSESPLPRLPSVLRSVRLRAGSLVPAPGSPVPPPATIRPHGRLQSGQAQIGVGGAGGW
jgi:hypothetical protein